MLPVPTSKNGAAQFWFCVAFWAKTDLTANPDNFVLRRSSTVVRVPKNRKWSKFPPPKMVPPSMVFFCGFGQNNGFGTVLIFNFLDFRLRNPDSSLICRSESMHGVIRFRRPSKKNGKQQKRRKTNKTKQKKLMQTGFSYYALFFVPLIFRFARWEYLKSTDSSQTTRAWVCRLDEEGLGRRGAGLCGLDW